MTQSPKDIEAEVETHRSKLAQDLDELRERMAPQRVLEDITHYVSLDDAQQALSSAARQVRAHPVAFGLIAAGLALLATRGQRQPRHGYPHAHDRTHTYGGHAPGPHPSYAPPPTRAGKTTRAKGAVHSAIDTASETVQHLAQGAKEYLHQGHDKAEAYRRAAADRLHAAQDGISEAYGHSRTTVRGLGQHASTQTASHPIAVGAAALTAGVIVGAALPRTRTEDEWIGPLHDRLAEEAYGLAAQTRDTVAEAAHAAYDAAVDTAKEEGLLPTGNKTLAERAEHVATAAAKEAKTTAKESSTLNT